MSAQEAQEARSWLLDAACRPVNPNVFFPSSEREAELALRICARCPVVAECEAETQELPHQFRQGVRAGRWLGGPTSYRNTQEGAHRRG